MNHSLVKGSLKVNHAVRSNFCTRLMISDALSLLLQSLTKKYKYYNKINKYKMLSSTRLCITVITLKR